jgi:hypothetical protein
MVLLRIVHLLQRALKFSATENLQLNLQFKDVLFQKLHMKKLLALAEQ